MINYSDSILANLNNKMQNRTIQPQAPGSYCSITLSSRQHHKGLTGVY